MNHSTNGIRGPPNQAQPKYSEISDYALKKLVRHLVNKLHGDGITVSAQTMPLAQDLMYNAFQKKWHRKPNWHEWRFVKKQLYNQLRF